ncbi:glycoside hydrolase family 15 protein [Novipirellula rosea]|uniref:Glycoside hydrolase family 15 protein n=1 Tax=Novipirellula rosea TaxID=1031540 RepID=A0ABP8MQU9_9BACT
MIFLERLTVVSKIEDYALLGDCRGAALVDKTGSMDWLCLPRFDSAACCSALLGNESHGFWKISPTDPIRKVQRRYRPGTLILETDITTDSGTIRLTDFMAPQTRESDVFRLVEGVEGEVEVVSRLALRFDYGGILPWVQHTDRGIRAIAGPECVYCTSDLQVQVDEQTMLSKFHLGPHQQAAFQLTWTRTQDPPPLEKNVLQTLEDATTWWQEWSGRCTFQGRWRKEVQQSLITLKALTYAPTGGIVAAATTSLPEHIGGVRNWDYRYCWIRDSTFTLYSLLIGGYTEEAKAWRKWLVNAAAGNPSQLQIMYGVAGERRLTELELDWLPGYENSSPVRTGNAAYRQHQLDVPGEIMETLHLARRYGLDADEDAWRVQTAVMEFLETQWEKPDEGIWEIRGDQRHFTHSKVMAWVAADRAVKDVEHFGMPGDAARWRKLRDRIHAEVCAKGFNEKLGGFVQSYGSDDTDASLLMLPLVGFVEANDPKMIGTLRLIEDRLVKDGLVVRYLTESNVDGLPEGEGAFLLCSFWLADNYALAGRESEATELFEMLLGLRNDVGLMSEEYDPHHKRMLGNFPQAFSHVGLVNTARNLVGEGGPAEERGHEED